MARPATHPAPPTPDELAQIEAANASGRQPVVFVHGLWLLASSWDPWRRLFEAAGFATIAPVWPDDPPTVAAGRAHPQAFAGKSVGAITAHYAEVMSGLTVKPAIVGHSFGGAIAQKLAGMGLGAVCVPIDPGPTAGVLSLPVSALRAAFPALKKPSNRQGAVMLTFEQWRFAFCNAVSETEARALYDEFPVPGAGLPLFQAALANVNPRSDLMVERHNPARGPMKFLSGERDNTVPWAITNASFKLQHRHNQRNTEIQEIPGRAHSLVIDSGWEEVAQVALDFVRTHAPATPVTPTS